MFIETYKGIEIFINATFVFWKVSQLNLFIDGSTVYSFTTTN